ncbi:MAG TPA: hypothetical protein VL498_07005 [Terracidiphilus sp.]|nr:hypothetical protein [Terracidiphilus sp.]
MPSTITIQNTINWEKAFLEQQPVLINGMEPALGAANLVLQTILGPPFAWPWNRGLVNFASATQDHVVGGLTDFNFLEGGTVQAVATGKPFEIAVKNLLHIDASNARPSFCSPFLDDGLGNITFRLTPAPDQNYNVTLPYQKKAPILASLAFTWAPVPDEKNYLCQWGHLALMSLIGADARFNEYNAKFIASLLGAQGGITDLERNIFLANWTRVMAQLQGTQLSTTERYKARET